MATKRKSRALPPLSPPSARSRRRTGPDSSPASVPIARTPFSAGALTPAQSLKSVLLSDWWLRRPQGKGLAVAGFEAKGGSGVRLFSSAAISKRHDSTTLETVDGITVIISGLINRSRTLQDGFSTEVCNHFLLGFPYFWEDCAVPSRSEEEPAKKTRAARLKNASASSSETRFTVSLDDMPASRLRDLVMSPLKGSDDSLRRETLNDVLGRLRRCTSQDNPMVSDQSERKCENSAGAEATDENETVVAVTGVRTRGMTRRMTPKETQAAASPEYSTRRRNRGAQVLTSEATRSRSGKSLREKKPESFL